MSNKYELYFLKVLLKKQTLTLETCILIYKILKENNFCQFIVFFIWARAAGILRGHDIFHQELQTNLIIFHRARINQQGLIESHNLWFECDKSKWNR